MAFLDNILGDDGNIDLSIFANVAFSGDFNDLINVPTNLSFFNNDVGFLTEYNEIDPIFESWLLANPVINYDLQIVTDNNNQTTNALFVISGDEISSLDFDGISGRTDTHIYPRKQYSYTQDGFNSTIRTDPEGLIVDSFQCTYDNFQIIRRTENNGSIGVLAPGQITLSTNNSLIDNIYKTGLLTSTVLSFTEDTSFTFEHKAFTVKVDFSTYVPGVQADQLFQGKSGTIALLSDIHNISLTTIGTSGPATLIGSVLNIPQYSGGSGSSYTFTTPLINTSGVISINQATTSTNGYLNNTDWNIFNNKFNTPTGTNLEYIAGDGSLITFPIFPTTATDLDALKRDGSNANADVDLGEYRLTATSLKSADSTNYTDGIFLAKASAGSVVIGDVAGTHGITKLSIDDIAQTIDISISSLDNLRANGYKVLTQVDYDDLSSSVDAYLLTKVDKVTGKSLILDTEITRIGTMATNANVGVVPNSAITGGTKTKITYDSKGLVVSGADATQDDILDGSTNRSFTNVEKTKLSGIASGATANSSDATLLARANHTGTQLASTISDFQTTTTNNTAVVANTAKVTNATHTGDATGSTALTLATVNSNVGTVGSSSKTVTVTTNAKGLTTAISEQNIQIAESQVTNLTTDLAGKQPLLGYTPYRFVQTSQTAILGSVVGTTETIIATATIPGGTFNANDIMRVIHKITKSAGVVSTLKLKINTSNTLSGATQIATFPTTTTYTYAKMVRTFDLQGGNLYGYGFTIGIISDDIANNTAPSSATYNTANTLYLFWTITLGSSADSVVPNLCSLTN